MEFSISVFTPLLTPLIALIASYIAIQQWRTNKEKLRLDLYDKRFAVYENTLALYRMLMSETLLTEKEKIDIQSNFIKSYRESQFLFSDSDGITKLLGDISSKTPVINNILSIHKAYIGNPDMQVQAHMNHLEALTFLNNSMPELEKRLAKYLNFHKAH
jgi:hypothetical protein